MDTIFAVASARGKAGVCVVRVSGPQAHEAARTFTGDLPSPRRAGLRRFRDWNGDLIDQALVLVFEEGHSFTGEKVAEFQLHGSTAVISAVLDCLGRVPGCRTAEPGEFTRRALENEVLDLSQIEGLGDLIEADTEAQRIQAVRVMTGALGEAAQSWRRELVEAIALLEVMIDFSDEEVPDDTTAEVKRIAGKVLRSLQKEASGVKAAERIRDGFEVAIVGNPNVGKSTLLNRLAGRDAAITSEIAGTTRDVIEVRMDVGGLPVTFLDTAGIRLSEDRIETLGVERTMERARTADLRIFLLSKKGDRLPFEANAQDVVIVGKADLNSGGEVSGLTGEGVDSLLERIGAVLEQRTQGVGIAIRERHRAALVAACSEISNSLAVLGEGSDRIEFAAEHLRLAIRSLDSLVGKVDIEHILDEIFARFCLGK
ncbi:MAG: tRNA uridine-5-carboxymethylaminomethyl(34) synthesis GTPase MnmE [Rhodobacter sp.]|nr:tRNA uridine-5-carboxymethylaminomethyl(34) synthesis GTPase MnmE [Rhodobacter sp.]